MIQNPDFPSIACEFLLEGDFHNCEPYGSGHIHDTYLISTRSGSEQYRYILQKFNNFVFGEPEKVLDNIAKITAHLQKSARQNTGISYLSMVLAGRNSYWYQDDQSDYWRCFHFIDNSFTLDRVENRDQAYEGARIFGNFILALYDFDPRKLNTTIPDFHNIEKRLNTLDKVVHSDAFTRRSAAQKEIGQISVHRHLASEYLSVFPDLPVRVAHNDTKINNILFDKNSGKGLCVIDLDTVMPGTVLSDFGDMVRSFTNSADEDEKDLSKVFFRPEIFSALSEGFLEETTHILSPVEKNNLILGGKLMIYMQAIRFLTDFLAGDKYYKTDYPEHNLVRARNQLKLLDLFLEHEKEAGKFLQSL